jgi:hypothetical protein
MGKGSFSVSDLRNPDKLGAAFVKAAGVLCGRLATLDMEVAADTLRYIVDGSHDQVLLTLGGMKGAADALLLRNHGSSVAWALREVASKERAELFEKGQLATPAVWIRLGQALEAIERAAGAMPQLPAGWPAWLVLLDEGIVASWYEKRSVGWTVDEVVAILRAGSLPETLLVRTCLDKDANETLKSWGRYYVPTNRGMSGWQAYLARHLDVVREALMREGTMIQSHVLRTLKELEFDFAPVTDLLVKLATGPSKTIRDEALPHLGTCRDVARPLIEQVMADGDASERNEAAVLLWRLHGKDAADCLSRHQANEASDRVKQTIEKLLSAPPEGDAEAGQALAAALPPLSIELGVVDLPEEAKEGLRQYFQRGYEDAERHHQAQVNQWNSPERPRWMSKPEKPEPIAAPRLEQLVRFVEGKDATPPENLPFARGDQLLGDWLKPPGVRLIHLVRISLALNHLHPGPQIWWLYNRNLEDYRAQSRPPFGLRELDAAVATLPRGHTGSVARYYLARNAYHNFADWEKEAIWPVFAEQSEILRAVLEPTAHGISPGSDPRQNAFRVLGYMPQLPPGFIRLLWDIALGENKTERPLAQAALHTVPDKASRILVALTDGRQEVRGAAAEWLGRLGDAVAIKPLEQAFRKEKNEAIKGIMLTALDRLGGDVNAFLDRKALLNEAVTGLAKKRPKGMEWVPMETLPALHWQDSGEMVDPRIIQWWLVQAIQQKSIAAGPLLRRYLDQCRKPEAEELARYVLSAWVARNTTVHPAEQAASLARAETDKRWPSYSKHDYWLTHYKNDKENMYRELLQQFSTQYVASAVGEKGMLAIPAAVGDRACVQMCDQFVRKHASDRPAPCKIVVELLGWMVHPLGIQVLLSLGARFRSQAIRKLANQHVKLLAEREGWTIDELADRTIPDAGFSRPVDEKGEPVGDRATLVLDYGPRQFTVTLDDDLEPVITTSEGKVVKNPPAAGKADDADKAKSARKAFTDAKKMVKEVVKRQSERLYEALCTQRSWSFSDWQRYLAHHPIAGRLCVRLAWSAWERHSKENGAAEEIYLGCFRPLEDRTLTNEKDEEVKLGPEVVVRLAHDCNTPTELVPAWLAHFTDYDVTPPFPQFGRATFTLPEDKGKTTEIKDFEGYMLTTFKLRGRATKLGWLRGDAEDGGSFRIYRKSFPSLGLQAVLEFTGSALPETDVSAALENLYFTPLKGERESGSSWGQTKLALGRVPAVLLSEIYNDVKQMAAEGSYDPEWQKKSYF